MNAQEKEKMARATCRTCFIAECLKHCDMCEFKKSLSMNIFYLENKVYGTSTKKKLVINRSGKTKTYLFDMRRGEAIRRRLETLATEKGKIFGLSTYKFIQ